MSYNIAFYIYKKKPYFKAFFYKYMFSIIYLHIKQYANCYAYQRNKFVTLVR